MNVTNNLKNVYFDERIIYGDEDDEVSKEAFDYLANLFPGIIYDDEADSYEYRGYEFDYFRSGRVVEDYLPTDRYSYSLSHKNNHYNWLCSPEGWDGFIRMDKRYKEMVKFNKPKNSWFQRFMDWLFPVDYD